MAVMRFDDSAKRVKGRVQVLSPVSIVTSLVIALAGCSTGESVDLGDESSGNLVASPKHEPYRRRPGRAEA